MAKFQLMGYCNSQKQINWKHDYWQHWKCEPSALSFCQQARTFDDQNHHMDGQKDQTPNQEKPYNHIWTGKTKFNFPVDAFSVTILLM